MILVLLSEDSSVLFPSTKNGSPRLAKTKKFNAMSEKPTAVIVSGSISSITFTLTLSSFSFLASFARNNGAVCILYTMGLEMNLVEERRKGEGE